MKTRIGLLLILPLLWLAPLLGDPMRVHYAPGAEYSDLVVAHWPSAEFLRQSLQQYGEIPMWNPHTLGGTPFAADPLSGLYYPPLWLALILPPPLAFNLLFFLHLAFAGIGAYLLSRGEGVGEMGALLAGIAFGGLPKLAAHVAAGHLTLVLAVAWTPWLLLAARAAARARNIRGWSLAGVIAGIVFLADPRWAIPSALAAIGYALSSGGGYPAQETRRLKILSWLRNLTAFGGFAAAISAVLALPMAEFVSLSTRANLTGVEGATQSLPFLSLVGMLFGGTGGSVEWVVYPGVVVLALFLASPPRSPSPGASREKGMGGEVGFWLILLLLSLILSLGSNIPGLAEIMNIIPGASLLRVPPRWMFLAGLALAMLAGRGLSALESRTDERGILRKAGFTLAAGGLILAAVSGAMRLPAALWQDGLMWGGLGLILFVGFLQKRWSLPASGALICLAVIDLAIADSRMIDPHTADPVFDGTAQAVSVLRQKKEYRIYSPSNSISQLEAVLNGLRTLDGVNPLILRSTAETVSNAAGVPMTGYSVTLPAFATGHPDSDNRSAILDWERLGLLGVRSVASAFEIQSTTPVPSYPYRNFSLYANPYPMPRVWVAADAGSWYVPIAVREDGVEFESPNRIRISAPGPGILVVPEASYPAWRARVDGKPAELLTVGGWWRAVAIGPGEHTVEMEYDPILSRVGLAITALALLAFFGVRRWAA